MTAPDLQRVRRRYRLVRMRFLAAGLVIGVQVLLTLLLLLRPVNPKVPFHWGIYSVVMLGIVAACVYQLRSVWHQYFGLQRDLKHGHKQIAIAPLRSKSTQRDADGQRYYLHFDLGLIQCGEKLYHRLNVGDLLTLTLSRYGRELLAVDRTDLHARPDDGTPRRLAGGQ